MPWTSSKEGTLPFLKNKSQEDRKIFARVANAALANGAVVQFAGVDLQEIAANGHAFGVSSNVNQASGTFNVSGLERVLSPNTTYLLRTTNKDTIAINIAAYLTFYEGEISSLN